MNESPENQDASDVPTSDAAEPTAIAADGDAQEALDDAAPVMDGDADIGGPVAPMEVVTVADEVTPPEEPTPEDAASEEHASEEPDAIADAPAPEAETPEEVVVVEEIEVVEAIEDETPAESVEAEDAAASLETEPEADDDTENVVIEPVAEVVEVEVVATPAAAKSAVPAAGEEEPAEERGRDPFRGPGDWYVVHTYAGYENKVKTNLESRIHTMQMEDKIFDVHIPMEDVMEIKGGKKQVVQRKVFPGYLLVKMVYDNDSWYVVRNTPGVTGFVAAGTGSKPTPLSRREVEKILAVKKEEVKPQFRLGFEENDVVRIISGPFADFNGTISEINLDQSKLKVLVNIFDRETPVELSFDQVAKV